MIAVRLGAAALAACAAAGSLVACGGGGGASTRTAPEPAPGARAHGATGPSGPTTPAPATKHARARARSVKVAVPRGWTQSHRIGSRRSWPVPLRVIASFPIEGRSSNAACPKAVLDAMPPDGVYILVAEYTKPRPRGIPASLPIRPRGDLDHLDIRPSEVECWEGPSGAARFADHGRDFYVEVLLGVRAGAKQRRRALDTLASLDVG